MSGGGSDCIRFCSRFPPPLKASPCLLQSTSPRASLKRDHGLAGTTGGITVFGPTPMLVKSPPEPANGAPPMIGPPPKDAIPMPPGPTPDSGIAAPPANPVPASPAPPAAAPAPAAPAAAAPAAAGNMKGKATPTAGKAYFIILPII